MVWRIAAVFILLALGVWCWVASAQFAHAHDWYSSTHDPVFSSNCCGGHDCAPVDPAWVFEEKDGFRLKMSLAQARTVNPTTQSPIDAFIPWSRVQSPPNSKAAFYACIYDADRSEPKRGVICFFATPTS